MAGQSRKTSVRGQGSREILPSGGGGVAGFDTSAKSVLFNL